MVSVIIPTLNEFSRVESLAHSLCELPDIEIVFSDGGSTDGTQEILERICKRCPNIYWLAAPCGRARQMNAAVEHTSGEWLIFLHADTRLPALSYQAFLEETQYKPLNTTTELVVGSFAFRIEHERPIYRYLEWYVAQRCRLLKLPFGDQAIFARRDFFISTGGYLEDFPLMEDMEFIQRVNQNPGFRVLEVPVFTSARRYESEGYFKRACGNIYLQILYRCGIHPQRLAAMYYK